MSENNGICPKCGNYEQIGGHACIVPSVATNSTAPTMSEKAATDDWIERKRGYCLAILNADDSKLDELMRPPRRSKLEAREYLSLIARIDAIQAENKRLRGLLERAFAWVYILRRDKTIYESGALDKLEEECGNVVQEQLDSASKETI